MGCCESTTRKKPPGTGHHNRQTIERIDRLGYAYGERIYGSDKIDATGRWFYPVLQDSSRLIAFLAASRRNGLLIVDQINTENDSRASGRRPLASDILLSFWKHKAQEPIESLKGVFFQTVENPETRAVKEEVYQALQIAPGERLILDRDTRNDDLKWAFRRALSDDCKLGRCVKTLAKDYIESKHCHHDLGSVEFIPFGGGAGLHLRVMLRPRQSRG